jgi:hypothetical protein
MNEDPMSGGSTENLTGATQAQDAQNIYQDLGTNYLPGIKQSGRLDTLSVNETFTEKEVKIAKKFISLVGGQERAATLLDKVIAADQMIGVESEEELDRQNIEKIAEIMPTEVDYPTDYSSAFNPSSNYNDF